MTLDEEIKDIIKTSKTIAVVGISRNPDKAAHGVPKYLQSQGYKIVPVNPKADKILGEKAYPTLKDLPLKVDIIDIFRPSEQTPAIVKVAVTLKPKLIWLQLGIANEEAEKIAKKHNISIVMNKCLKVEHMKIARKS
ncbi:MAG: CoA-binding protein [Asgard group archaeon]|nr:CoA-binding protein [Asgard group archaeon]